MKGFYFCPMCGGEGLQTDWDRKARARSLPPRLPICTELPDELACGGVAVAWAVEVMIRHGFDVLPAERSVAAQPFYFMFWIDGERCITKHHLIHLATGLTERG